MHSASDPVAFTSTRSHRARYRKEFGKSSERIRKDFGKSSERTRNVACSKGYLSARSTYVHNKDGRATNLGWYLQKVGSIGLVKSVKHSNGTHSTCRRLYVLCAAWMSAGCSGAALSGLCMLLRACLQARRLVSAAQSASGKAQT